MNEPLLKEKISTNSKEYWNVQLKTKAGMFSENIFQIANFHFQRFVFFKVSV